MNSMLGRVLLGLSIFVTLVTCGPQSHHRSHSHSHDRSGSHQEDGSGDDIQTRQGGPSRHHGHYPDTTKACADDLGATGNCDNFHKCCKTMCDTAKQGHESQCVVRNDEAQLRCMCRGDHGRSGSHEAPAHFPAPAPIPAPAPAPAPVPAPAPAPSPVTNTAAFLNPSQWSAGNRRCGVPPIQPTARIVGGDQAKPHSWPWQISLRLRGRHLCGGALITNQSIVTAAHCFSMSSQTSNYQVVVGMHDREAQSDGSMVGISRIYVNPKYNEEDNSYDAAVAILSKPVTLSNTVLPVCLPQRDVPETASCEVTGWGKTQGSGNNRYLMQVRVPIVPRSTCNDRSHYDGLIRNTMICAGAPGKDSCQGDSGGPLVCQRSDGVWELQGITSWGSHCGYPNRPGVYTRVTTVESWVKQITRA